MKRLGIFGALVAAIVLMGVASAAPPGQAIAFRMPDGEFNTAEEGFPAAAKFDGTIAFGDPTTLSNLSGNILIGSSPFGKTDRHLKMKAPGPVTGGPFGDGEGFKACEEGKTGPWEFYEIGFEMSTIVSIGAGSLKGTGRLAWGHAEFCQQQEVEPGVFELMIWGGPFSDLSALLADSKTAGKLNLHGEHPEIGP